MLFVFHGNDIVAVRSRAHAFLQEHEERGVRVVCIDPDLYEKGILADRAGASSLFSEEQVTLVDTPSEKKEVFEDVLEHAEVLGESSNTFVIIEGALRAAEKKIFTKHASKIHEEKAVEKQVFNLFGMTDALLRRDKKTLFLLLNQAREKKVTGEEIVGVLYWQIKMLLLAQNTGSAGEAELKPFVYSKAKRALSKFQDGELETLSRKILSIYHEGHLGKRDINIALERFVLSL